MLGIRRRKVFEDDPQASVHNYFERLVYARIRQDSERALVDGNFLADVACVALNRLPPRYVRHDVDMTFFMTPDEIKSMADAVTHAVADAIAYVENRSDPKGN